MVNANFDQKIKRRSVSHHHHINPNIIKDINDNFKLKDLARSWKGKVNKSEVEYVRELRQQWNKRAKRLEL